MTQSIIDHLGITQWRLRTQPLDGVVRLTPEAHTNAPQKDVGLPQLNQQISVCQACPRGQVRAHAVTGSGNPQADLMIIGAMPSAADDKIGAVFTGEVGALLDKMLAAIGQSRDSVYLTQALKCYDQKRPSAADIAACLPFLQQEIRTVQPRVLLSFGALAAQALLARAEPLITLREQALHYGTIPLIVTYAPEHLLHHPADKRAAFQDLLRTQALLRDNER